MEQKTQLQETLKNKNNPWQEKLEKQGINFTISEKYLKTPDPNFQIDEKTGFVIETGNVRTYLVEKISDSIRKGNSWAVVHADVDNLKAANTKHTRLFGDMAIKYGAAAITHLVDKANLSSNVEIITTKDGQAADEYCVWLFDLSDGEIKKLHHEISILDYGIKTSNPEFNFSISSTFLAYNDLRIQKQLEETKNFLISDKNHFSYDFYQHFIKDLTAEDVGKIKIEKDMDRLQNLSQDQLLTETNMERFIDEIVTIFGNSRLSDKLLAVLLKLASAQTAISIAKSPESKEVFIDLLEKIGVNEKQINKAKTSDDLLNIFKGLFGF